MVDKFHPAVKLLLARMESNPEDFMSGGRLGLFHRGYDEHFTKEERAAVRAAYAKIQMNEMHTVLMKKLLAPEPTVRLYPYYEMGPFPTTPIVTSGASVPCKAEGQPIFTLTIAKEHLA